MTATAEPTVMFPEVTGPDFIRSPEVEVGATSVLVRHVKPLGELPRAIADEDIHVLYLRNDRPFDAVNEEVTHDAIAKAMKAPRLWRDVTGFDAVVWVRGYFWDQFDERQRSALLFHELLHLEVGYDTKGRVRLAIRPHSIEEHHAVVRYYGDWLPDVATFVKAYGLFEGDRGEPSVVEAARRFKQSIEEGDTDVTITAGDRSVSIKGRGNGNAHA